MSVNPYEATNSITAKPSTLAETGINFAIYVGIINVTLFGIAVWGALGYKLISLVFQHESVLDFALSYFNFARALMVFAPFPLAFGILKRSRLCAATPVLLYAGAMIWVIKIMGDPLRWEWPLSIPIVFILTSLLGLAGTILHHRHQKTSLRKAPA